MISFMQFIMFLHHAQYGPTWIEADHARRKEDTRNKARDHVEQRHLHDIRHGVIREP